jgi:hypothetical protein
VNVVEPVVEDGVPCLREGSGKEESSKSDSTHENDDRGLDTTTGTPVRGNQLILSRMVAINSPLREGHVSAREKSLRMTHFASSLMRHITIGGHKRK